MSNPAPWLRIGFHDVAARTQMNVVKKIFAGRRNTGGNAGFLQQPKNLPYRKLARPLRKFSIELIAMLFSPATGRIFRIGGPRICADQLDHALPLLISRTGNDDPVVFAAAGIATVRRVRIAENLAIAQRVPFIAVDGIIENRRSHHRSLRFEHPGFDELTVPGACLILEGGEDAKRHRHRADSIGPGNFAAGFHRRVRVTPQAHDPRVSEQLPTPRDPRSERPGQTPAGHHDLHDAWIDFLQNLKAKTESLQNSGAEVVYNDV